jgi:hypothetical protein
MRWVRSKIRFGAGLALFALAIQILLSLGHVHLYALSLASAKSAPLAIADGSGAAAPSTLAPLNKSDGSADADCAICALIQLSATSVPSAAPTLPLPANLGPSGLQAPHALALAAVPHSLFQARAPPSI